MWQVFKFAVLFFTFLKKTKLYKLTATNFVLFLFSFSLLFEEFLVTLQKTGADYTNCFRCLSNFPLPNSPDFEERKLETLNQLLSQSSTLDELKEINKPPPPNRWVYRTCGLVMVSLGRNNKNLMTFLHEFISCNQFPMCISSQLSLLMMMVQNKPNLLPIVKLKMPGLEAEYKKGAVLQALQVKQMFSSFLFWFVFAQ